MGRHRQPDLHHPGPDLSSFDTVTAEESSGENDFSGWRARSLPEPADPDYEPAYEYAGARYSAETPPDARLPYGYGFSYDAEPAYRLDVDGSAGHSGHDTDFGYEPLAGSGRHRADEDLQPAYIDPGSSYGWDADPEPRSRRAGDEHDLAAHYLGFEVPESPVPEPPAPESPAPVFPAPEPAPEATTAFDPVEYDAPIVPEPEHPGLDTGERSYAETLYPRLAASARTADLDSAVLAEDPIDPDLHFTGPRFAPLPAPDFEPEPDATQTFSLPAPEPDGFVDAAETEQVTPARSAYAALAAGRHRAEAAGVLGRHRGERTGIVHSMSGRAVFATAIATALTAGGVGAAATLPVEHDDSAPAPHSSIRTTSAATASPDLATVADTTAGTRLAVNVSTTAPRSFRSTNARPAATSAAKRAAKKRARKAAPAGATVISGNSRAAEPYSTPATTPASAKPRIVLPKWVRPGTGVISSGYGPRWGAFHYGIDFAAPYGAPIYAAGDGVVLRTGPATGFGEAIYIQHANGDTTVYGHEETTLVHPGEHVHAGQLIARVGAEGEATGPHLHFEVHQGSEYGPKIDPGPWLAARGVKI